jgi:predicted nucleic acid-binding protein
MTIFDSNIWIAYFNDDDQTHRQASRIFRSVETTSIVVTEYIILEVATILKQKKGNELANTFLSFVAELDIPVVMSGEFYTGTKNLFQSLKEKHLSFVDVSLLYLSKKYTVATLDKHLKKVLKV